MSVAGNRRFFRFSGYLCQQLSSVKIVNTGFPWQATEEKSFFVAGLVLSVLQADFQKELEKNSSSEEEGINALIDQCVAGSLGGGIDSQEKIDL